MIFTLEPLPPFRLDLTVWALRRRPSNAIDRWDGATYRRVLVIDGRPVEVAVVQHGDRLEVRAERGRGAVAAALRRMLGLDVDLQPFYALAERDPALDRIAQRFRGMKPPRFPTVWEALANAVTCQQISLSAGMVVLSRLGRRSGTSPASARWPPCRRKTSARWATALPRRALCGRPTARTWNGWPA